jgi:hypothetical protein
VVHMKKIWEKRLLKLESRLQFRPLPPMVFRYGPIRYLPPDTLGERHIAILKSEPTALVNVEHSEFEERVGPAPEAHQDLSVTVYLTAEGENGNAP